MNFTFRPTAVRCPKPVLIEDVALSAAHLVAAIDSTMKRSSLSDDARDSFEILRTECEAAGLLNSYPRDPDGRYCLPQPVPRDSMNNPKESRDD